LNDASIPPPTGRSTLWRWLRRGLAGLVLLLLAAVAVLVIVLRLTVPSTSGKLAIAGLGAPVDISFDSEAVPHVFAETPEDAYRALGFLHAQNRLWQMELMRRAGQGRLSEVFGAATLEHDKFLRTLDLYGHAQRSIGVLSVRAKAALDAYAQGVNSWLDRPTGLLEPRLPPEFVLLAHRPEPWRPADTLVALKMMALQLSRNMNKEIDRLVLAAHGSSPAEIENLMSTEARWGAPPLPDLRGLYPLRRPEGPTVKRAALDFASDGASNNWVIAGHRTKSGKPLLANDPHLRLTAPSTWYLAHLAIGPGDKPSNLVGASLPGTPLIVLGRSDAFAWGLTNTESDVEDLYVERVKPDDPNQYATPEGWRAFDRDEVTIRVRFGDDVKLVRRKTRHGPVISSVYRNLGSYLAPDHVVALRWATLTDDDTTFEAGLFDPAMRTVGDVIERMRPNIGPMQSLVVADTTGSIGLIAPGRIPIRDPANSVAGRAPVPGWDAVYDWKGFVPFEALPRQVDPASGAIATSNTRIVEPGYPHLLTWDWGAVFRQERLEQIVMKPDNHDVASMWAAQLDIVSPYARRLKEHLVAGARAAGSRQAEIIDLLARWDGSMRAEATEPLLFTAWLKHTIEHVWDDDLGAAAGLAMDERLVALLDLLEGRATARDWCDDARTPEKESCAQMIAQSLDAALADLGRRYGLDRTKWVWGIAHYADGLHEPFGRLPWIGSLFNVRVPSGGGMFTINRAGPILTSSDPYANKVGTTFRAVFDLADLEASRFIQSTGQSGNPFSVHYRSFAERWRRGDYVTIPTRRDVIGTRQTGHWQLRPAAR
jgi:penicillin G amidase